MAGAQRTQTLVEALRPRLDELEVGVGRLEGQLSAVRGLVETVEDRGRRAAVASAATTAAEWRGKREEEETQTRLEEEERWAERSERSEEQARAFEEEVLDRLESSQRRLQEQVQRNTAYNALFTYTAAALTVPALYLLLRATG